MLRLEGATLKDFVAGFIALRAFLTHGEVRVVTTSVRDDHLRVLWGEIGRYIQNSSIPLTVEDGGPLIVNHRDIRKVIAVRGPDGGVTYKRCEISYLRGMVSERAEGMTGHHAAYTLAILDEASGIDQETYNAVCTWSKRRLIFGNPHDVPRTHFFRNAVAQGDLLARA